MSHHEHPGGREEVAHLHIEPIPVYLGIFAALMVLTGATVWAAFQDFGRMNDVVAMAIAGAKAILVAMFFMHLRHASRLTKLVAVSGIFWLVILVSFTVSDFFTRGMVAPGK